MLEGRTDKEGVVLVIIGYNIFHRWDDRREVRALLDNPPLGRIIPVALTPFPVYDSIHE